MGEEMVQIHHMSKPAGEKLEIECPHCRNKIVVSLKTMPADEDTVIFGYRKKSD